MALFHLSVTQTKRNAGQSAIASAAYRAGERLYSEYYGEYSDYTRKGGVICSDILLPSHAPPEYADRQTLWNAVEKAERGKNAQLAYSFDIALQNEFSLEENIALARQFLLENFVSRGMVVDFAVHQPDREDGGIPNPHFHVLCPIRPIEQNGKWGLKQRRVYELDEDGNVSETQTETLCSTPFPLPTGAVPKRWNIGGRHGRNYTTPSLRRKGLMFVSTTEAMSVRAWIYFPLSMKCATVRAMEKKSKVSNLKEMNETFNYLRANGIYSLEDLESRVSEHSAATESLKKTLDEQTARMKAIKQLYDSSAAFQSLKPVYDGLQKIKFEKPRAKYKAEHEAELKQFYAARRKLTGEFPDGKVDMKKLTEEYDELEQAHNKGTYP